MHALLRSHTPVQLWPGGSVKSIGPVAKSIIDGAKDGLPKIEDKYILRILKFNNASVRIKWQELSGKARKPGEGIVTIRLRRQVTITSSGEILFRVRLLEFRQTKFGVSCVLEITDAHKPWPTGNGHIEWLHGYKCVR